MTRFRALSVVLVLALAPAVRAQALSPAFVPALFAFPAEPRSDLGSVKWATVRGQVVFGGEKFPEPEMVNQRRPNLPPVEVHKWIVNPKTKGVKNVIVWITTDPENRGIGMPRQKIHPDLLKVPAESAEIGVVGLQYAPAALAFRAGQKLVFKNTGSEAVCFRYHAKELNGNVVVPQGKEHVVADATAEPTPIFVTNNIHPWMRAHARVFDHPYYAVTDEDGKFEIRLVPVGKVRLFVWHPESGFRDGAKGNRGDEIDVKPRGIDIGQLKLKPIE